MLIVKIVALIVAFLISALPIASAAAGPACFFDVFEPQALTRELTDALPASGIAVVSLGRGTSSEQEATGTNSRLLLMRDGDIVGELYTSTDVRAAKAEMTVLSAAGDVLMHFEESRSPCIAPRSAGLCARITGYTELESPLDGHPAYSLYLGPDESFPTYFRYDSNVNRLEYRRALVSTIDWLIATLDSTDVTRQPVSATAEERLYWTLASNPVVAPYIGRLTIVTRRDHLVIQGIVPSNFVYDQVVAAALDAGLWTIVPDLVIDTGTFIVDRGPILSRCL